MQAEAAAALPLVAPHSAARRPPAMGGDGEVLQLLAARRTAAPDRRADAGLQREFDGEVVAEEHG